MTVEVKVPEIGESVTEIIIGQWSKSEGEAVEQDEALVELESEKATLDLRAPAAGVLARVLKRSGDTAAVGEVIATIEGRAEGQSPEKWSDQPATAELPVAKKGSPTKLATEAESPAIAAEPHAPATSHDTRRKQPPATTIKSDEAGELTAEQASRGPQGPSPIETSRPSVLVAQGVEGPARRVERRPMSPIRRRIAQRLVEAQRNAALLTTFNEVDMTAIKQLRRRCGQAFADKHHVRLGYMAFFIKATIDALAECPELNAAIDGDDIVYHDYFDIGVAISSDKGLVVPILRNVNRMSFAQIETTIDDLANRARNGQLRINELQGGTFTITNGGVFGSLLSTPIVNPPQSGVLGMHAIQDRPVTVHDEVVVRPMMYVALTYDHRVVDGREAVTFLKCIKDTIEDPARLLIGI